MSEVVYKTVEEIAQAFAEIVSRNYLKNLQFWQATAADDLDEFLDWEEKIKTEPEKVKKAAFEKILQIMQEPQKNKQFYKKGFFFRSKNIIRVSTESGYYKDLLPDKDITHTVAVNVEYIIDIQRRIIQKRIYESY